MKISQKIFRLRTENGLTQVQFGKIAGVTDKAVSTWELGLKEPRMKPLQKICTHFGIDINLFVDSNSDVYNAPERGPGRNMIKIAGRDGSFVQRELTDEQAALMKTMLDQLRPVDDTNI